MASSVATITEEYAAAEGRTVVLRKEIAAIQALSNGYGRPSLGLMVRLAKGLQVELTGSGFSDGTVKVRTKGEFFFVLRRNVMI